MSASRAAVVTGGHRRVGRAIALALARRGLDVHITWQSRPAEAEAAVGELRAAGVAATAHRLELADPEAVRAFAARVWDDAGGVGVLVNCASIYPRQPLADVGDDDWDRVLAVNLRAPFELSRALGLRMQARAAADGCAGGSIVNLLDWATDRPYAGCLPYFVSKAGLQGLTRALAVELAPLVRVNGVAPGAVLLPEGTTDRERRSIARATPLRRVGRADDVAAAVVFLALDTDFATGEVVCVDGGRRLA